MHTDFSIVTPSFNQAQFVGRTLESVRCQQGVSVQHVVVDPGSTDGSRDVIRQFGHVTLVEKPDNCQSQGINNGFAECTGRYMAWLNSDDIYPSSEVLAQVKACFEAHPEADVVYGNAIFIDADGQFLRNYYVNGNAAGLCQSLEYQVGICQPAVFWRREIYEALGGLDESLDFQLDYEYWIRMCQAGKVWKHVNAVLAAHRWWPGMKTASQRGASLRESLNLVKQRFGYVHPKWAERLAALQVDASDGIINLSQGNEHLVAQRKREILRRVNTDACTLERMASTENAGMREALAELKASGVDTTPQCLDAMRLSYADAPPRYLFPEDEQHTSIARRPDVRSLADGSGEVVVYAAEPGFQVAQRLSDFQRAQKALAEYLDSQPAGGDRTCVVVANGPSLTRSIDDTLLGMDLVISNFAYKDDRLRKHAKYFTIVNHTVAAQVYADWMLLDDLVKVFPFWMGRHVPQLPNTYYVNSTVVPEFSGDARRYLSWRSTVSYFNMQMAYSLGYRRILLVGFDNSYVQPPTVREGDEIVQVQDDPNHFLKNYFKGKTWQAADTGNMNDSYCEALAFAMAHDVEIVNCTVGGQLHVFPRGPLAAYARPHDALAAAAQHQLGRRPKGWACLTPVEMALLAHAPGLARVFDSDGPVRYASLPEHARGQLLAQARAVGREPVSPHQGLRPAK